MQQHPKSVIRKKILTLLRNQKEEERFSKSKVILEKLFALPEFRHAKTVMCYASFDGEVDTFPMMKQALKIGKKIVLPFIMKAKTRIIPRLIENLEDGLSPGPYGVPQPAEDYSQPVAA